MPTIRRQQWVVQGNNEQQGDDIYRKVTTSNKQ
jgi:hypothetical protein